MAAHLLLAALLVQPGTPAASSVRDLGWMAGCWKLTAGSRSVTEYWLPPEGDTMLGVSRTVEGNRTVDYEFILLRQAGPGLQYVAKPAAQPEAVFTATRIRAGEAVFENPAHDFPTRITYRRIEGGLLATITGTARGQPREVEFRYARGDCAR